uniref:Arrestin C-terminal-like domain-containing protein n=1 Tax=Amphiprion percula TaxID=161767 RepID=A0A3P8TNJ4_AMPPE
MLQADSTTSALSMFCFPGEGIKVVASIQNRSSSEVRPKYCLDKKCSYFAKGKWKVETEEILKVWGEHLPLHANRTVTKIITVPPTTPASILNCSIIRVEYRLRVCIYLQTLSNDGSHTE